MSVGLQHPVHKPPWRLHSQGSPPHQVTAPRTSTYTGHVHLAVEHLYFHLPTCQVVLGVFAVGPWQQLLCNVSAPGLLAPCCDTRKRIDNLNLEKHLCGSLFGVNPFLFQITMIVCREIIHFHPYRLRGYLGSKDERASISWPCFVSTMASRLHALWTRDHDEMIPHWWVQHVPLRSSSLKNTRIHATDHCTSHKFFFQQFLSRDVTTASCTIVNLKCVSCWLRCSAIRIPSVQSKAPRYPF